MAPSHVSRDAGLRRSNSDLQALRSRDDTIAYLLMAQQTLRLRTTSVRISAMLTQSKASPDSAYRWRICPAFGIDAEARRKTCASQ
jgi:hypothetical protein